MSEPNRNDTGWADNPVIKQRIRAALYIVCALLLGVELLIHRHTYNDVESIPFFHALYGFAALVFAVLVAKGLRALVKRDEDYYDS
ncbi:hypothetical protein G4Y73_01870 [Wenzhouxiangella sp. XN201]|uniref:hypothetical protein n=1 Tax=Wenzhouxiangella sp. XN201 TaxID=2710755 RepID=UPI0013C9AD4F|nr:hypothetical protein [Wenzhouxiangella sp. XN201]NEZ02893.1 hypothetical protein [Wenzhouxiangella sp. XN201]